MSAQIIDSFEFCRSAGRVSGTTLVAEFTRLRADLADSSGELTWSFQGGHHPDGHPQLIMEVSGEVRLVCQRCLRPFTLPFQTRTTLLLAADEATADQLEARIDDDSIDVIVGSRVMDLLVLVEDEALLALPLSPRHEVCPGVEPKVVEEKEESPFAVLRRLKQ